MRTFLCIAFFSLLFCTAHAQEKFIEVTVTDTAMVKPDQFIYQLMLIPDENFETDTLRYADPVAFRKNSASLKNKRSQQMDSLKQELRKMGFNIFPPNLAEQFNYSAASDFYSAGLTVLTGTTDSLKLLVSMIKKNKSFAGVVTSVFARDETSWFKGLHKKIMQQAERNAGDLALLSGRKLGKIISVIQNKETKEKSSGWAIYPPLSSLYSDTVPGWHTEIKNRNDFVTFSSDEISTRYAIQDTLVVRFAME
jgi:outer membrane protein OmpA-like peptidoglycan-associated protein